CPTPRSRARPRALRGAEAPPAVPPRRARLHAPGQSGGPKHDNLWLAVAAIGDYNNAKIKRGGRNDRSVSGCAAEASQGYGEREARHRCVVARHGLRVV